MDSYSFLMEGMGGDDSDVEALRSEIKDHLSRSESPLLKMKSRVRQLEDDLSVVVAENAQLRRQIAQQTDQIARLKRTLSGDDGFQVLELRVQSSR